MTPTSKLKKKKKNVFTAELFLSISLSFSSTFCNLSHILLCSVVWSHRTGHVIALVEAFSVCRLNDFLHLCQAMALPSVEKPPIKMNFCCVVNFVSLSMLDKRGHLWMFIRKVHSLLYVHYKMELYNLVCLYTLWFIEILALKYQSFLISKALVVEAHTRYQVTKQKTFLNFSSFCLNLERFWIAFWMFVHTLGV